jgi:hypothetical protein
MKWRIESKGKLSGNKFLLNVLAESLEGDCFSVESAHSVDDFPKLFITESVIELAVDVLELFNGQFSSSLKVIQAEVGTSSFFAEWVSLE